LEHTEGLTNKVTDKLNDEDDVEKIYKEKRINKIPLCIRTFVHRAGCVLVEHLKIMGDLYQEQPYIFVDYHTAPLWVPDLHGPSTNLMF
jgi:hypothetical protein